MEGVGSLRICNRVTGMIHLDSQNRKRAFSHPLKVAIVSVL